MTRQELKETLISILEMQKNVTIELGENIGYDEFAKEVAFILKDQYGPHNYKPFLQVLVAELKKEN